MKTEITCLRVLGEVEKDGRLLAAVASVREGARDEAVFVAKLDDFRKVPGSPFAYWVSAGLRSLFWTLDAFEGDNRTVKQGLATSNDFRFVRLAWEIPPAERRQWPPLAKGGVYSPFYADISVLVNWRHAGEEIMREADRRYSHIAGYQTFWVVKNVDSYFQPGITWPLRASAFSPQVLPSGCIFSARGYAMQAPRRELEWLLGLMSSSAFDYLFKMLLGRYGHPEFIVGVLQKLPVPSVTEADKLVLAELAKRAWAAKRDLDTSSLTSHAFVVPAVFAEPAASLMESAKRWNQKIDASIACIADAKHKIDELVCTLYRLNEEDRRNVHGAQAADSGADEDAQEGPEEDSAEPIEVDIKGLVLNAIDYMVGCAFGRWDIRFLTGQKRPPQVPDPFDPLPVCPPGQLQNDDNMPLAKAEVEILTKEERWKYPVEVPWEGVLVDDSGHPLDLDARIRQVLQMVWLEGWELVEREACEIIGVRSFRDHLRKSTSFFADHLKRYSKSRRQAPIYWPLSVPSCEYTLWVYYHRLTDQTLYRCVMDFVEPKLKQVAEEANRLRRKGSRSIAEEKELERLGDLELELKDFRDELLRIAKFWKPNLNDGVQITAAPLWKLFQYKPWQKKLKETWESLEKGEYDWAHLAYSIWPDRVREKCRSDRSLAIAHGLEDLYEGPVSAPKKPRGRKKAAQVEMEGNGDHE